MSDPAGRLLIIGCGYIGMAVAAALKQRGGGGPTAVTGATTSPERFEELRAAGVAPLRLELADGEQLRRALETHAAVLVAAAPRKGRPPGPDGEAYREVYLRGMENLLRAAEDHPPRRLVYTSSISVYGRDDGAWVDESSPAEPAGENGRILLETEQALLAGAPRLGISAAILRLSGLHGPGRGPQNRIAAMSGTERSDGDAWLNLVHRDDAAEALRLLLAHRFEGVLNLNDDRPTTRREYYDRLLAASRMPPIRWMAPAAGSGLGKRVRNDLAKRVLGLRLLHPEH